LGGSKQEKFDFIKQHIYKDIKIKDIFDAGELIDVTAVTKGKGFQGTVKRFGVSIRSHKSEKVKRGIGNLGAWTPTHVDFRVPQPGKMGYHIRTELNKWILKISDEDINPKGGFLHYGLIKNDYVILKGSIAGPSKRVIRMTIAGRPNRSVPKEATELDKIMIR
jgi:large subunit ribosomal protein L3